MIRALPAALLAAALLAPPLLAIAAAAPAMAAPGGPIGTLPLGHWVCELPGDATASVGRRLPDADFTVTNASSYTAQGLPGTYLLTGNSVTMTSGPMNGTRFRRVSTNFLRQLDAAGQQTTLRCVREMQNNRVGP